MLNYGSLYKVYTWNLDSDMGCEFRNCKSCEVKKFKSIRMKIIFESKISVNCSISNTNFSNIN